MSMKITPIIADDQLSHLITEGGFEPTAKAVLSMCLERFSHDRRTFTEEYGKLKEKCDLFEAKVHELDPDGQRLAPVPK